MVVITIIKIGVQTSFLKYFSGTDDKQLQLCFSLVVVITQFEKHYSATMCFPC
jgi:hypothetical protein